MKGGFLVNGQIAIKHDETYLLTLEKTTFLSLEKIRWLFSLQDSPMSAFEWIIWLLYSLELPENHRFSDSFRDGVELNWFAWTRFVWFHCSGGVPLVLHWYSIGILGCSAGVLGNIQLFHHCSAGVPCSAALCSGIPGFIVSHSLCTHTTHRWSAQTEMDIHRSS